MIAPNSRIIILKSPIELDELNQITFSSATTQFEYFYSLTKVEEDNCTFQRKDNVLRFPTNEDFTFDDLIQYNYCMYQNTSYGNKWFYAFITKCNYINDGMCELTLKTDVFQTWQFDMTWKQSFIEREHVSVANDTYHSNTVEENIIYNDYRNQYKTEYTFGTTHAVLASTVSPVDATNVGMGVYGGITSGCKYYIFQNNTYLSDGLQKIANAGKSSGIVSLFLAPDWLTGYDSATFTNGIAEVPQTTEQTQTNGFAVPLTPTVIGSYTPKNKKIFNYPWVYYVLANNSGNEVILKIEDFVDDGTHFGSINLYGTICAGCSIRAIPVNYEVGDIDFATGLNNEYGLNLGKFPICSYPVDSYTNWLTQNSVNIGLNVASSALTGAVGVIAGSPTTTASGILGIAQSIGSIYEHSLIPPSVEGNTNSGDITYAMGKLVFSGYYKMIKEEKAKILDDYFSMYGYATKKVKLPNLNTRSNWNYIKTINANIIGDIPQNDLQELKEMFNNGVTLWHTTTYFLDYSRTNS